MNRRVYWSAKELEHRRGISFTVVSSGHTSDSLEAQAQELCAIWNSGTDVLILITNGLYPDNQGDVIN